MNTILTHMLTESDNKTHDVFRWITLITILVGLGLEIYVVVRGQAFDLMNYGTGIGALVTGAGIALKLKPETGGPT